MFNKPNRNQHFFVILMIGLAVFLGAEPRTAESAAPSLTLGKTVVGEGDDYATRVLGFPWWNLNGPPYPDDFTALKNINEGTFSVTNDGFWQMTSTSDDANMWLSWPGLDLTQVVLKMGASNPIDANKYKLVSYYMCLAKAPAQNNETWASIIYWFYDRMPFTDPGNGLSNFLFFYQQGKFKEDGDCELLTFDLSQPAAWMTGSWNNNPRQPIGFRLDPVNVSNMGFKVGWVRLTTKDTGNIVPLSWSGAPPGQNEFYVSLTGCGQNGVLVGGKSGASGTFNWGQQVIPGFSEVHPLPLPESFEPGQYHLYMKDSTGGITCAGNNPLTVSPAPVFAFQKPSFQSGPDFATETLGDPWGMASSGDVNKIVNADFTSFTDGILTMTSNDNDPQIFMNLGGNTIPADSYRYASFRFKINGNHTYQSDWVQRWIWWYSGGPFVDHVTTQDMEIYEGWHVYTLDMENALTENCASNCWSGNPRVFRFDPFETPKPTNIQMDYVLLTGPETVIQGDLFRIAFTTDASPDATLTFYYDNDKDPGNGRTKIGVFGVPNMAQTPSGGGPFQLFFPSTFMIDNSEIPLYSNSQFYHWDTANVPKGTYFVSAVVDDGIIKTTWYSELPVTVK